ncbi:Hachiman antiphage defense system protein HamA [Lactococcus nasutitermitis]|uniref:Hachiman antiphage defense system protein HamA n=1 Tax=Lactococcus nasutitermitis TaxID=1652957 RepID=A0ABV9JH62_9LACT|nr:Hachiman antiphage defense system protein HamA [Lactococcus nasutitermitis]
MSNSHLKYFQKKSDLVTNQGKIVTIYELKIDHDISIINEWARHLREEYCSDEELDFLVPDMGLTNQEFLTQIKFPDPDIGLGAATMSGDFAEILVSDYIEFIQGYYTTRTRYRNKINRNSSPMGSDVLGYKCKNVNSHSSNDELQVLEVKAQASETKPEAKLQKAVNDSIKSNDELRLAESLNAEVQRLWGYNRLKEAELVKRFQNKTDRPYKLVFSAVAVHSNRSYSEDLVKQVDVTKNINQNLNLLVIYSDQLLKFIKELYERASQC